jgi:hypothetical protein
MGVKKWREQAVNDYFMSSMIRQRHAQILAEVRACRMSQQGRQRTTRGIRNLFRMFRSLLAQGKIPMVRSRPALDESKSI